MEPRGPLSTPAFRTLWAAGIISDAGDWLLLVALPIVVFDISGSAIGTAAAFAAELGPGIVLAPLAGRLADALDRSGGFMLDGARIPRDLADAAIAGL